MSIDATDSAVRDSGRRGGRDARRQARASKLSDADRPIWPGLPGGRYQVLSQDDMQKIHHKILDVLEQIGFADAIPSTIEYMTKAGAYIDKNDGRMKFPRALVEDTIAKAARRFPLYAQDPRPRVWKRVLGGAHRGPHGDHCHERQNRLRRCS